MPVLSLDAKWIIGILITIMIVFFAANRSQLSRTETELALSLEDDLSAFRRAMAVEHRAMAIEANLYTDKDRDGKFTTTDIESRDTRMNRFEDDLDGIQDMLSRLTVTMETFDDWANGLANRGRERTAEIAQLGTELTSLQVQFNQVHINQRAIQGKQDTVRDRLEELRTRVDEFLRRTQPTY